MARGMERRNYLEQIKGYEILKTTVFENSRGFALGHNPAAPSPYVTWQFTEGKDGQRDYYWGHYGNSRAWAEKDFARRVDDYKDLQQTTTRSISEQPKECYLYYSTQRPIDLGTFPKPAGNPPLEIINYDDDRRRPVAGGSIEAWGELTYAKPLTEKQVADYELKPSPDNPDQPCRSITARLKETPARQEADIRSQKPHYKNQEER